MERTETSLRISAIFNPILGAMAAHRHHPMVAGKVFVGAELQHLACLVKLLELGAKTQAPGMWRTAHPSTTASSMAAMRPPLQMARLLLEQGADPYAKDLMGIVPLSYGVLQADVGFIKLLLEFKADPGIPNVEGLAPHMMTLVSPEISFLLMEGMKRSCSKLFLHLCPLFRLRLRHQLQLQPMLPLKNVL